MLHSLRTGIWYWQGGVTFGIVEGDDRQLILIDAGLDASAPRKALRPFLEEGYRLAAVVATHCHTDHIGGAAELRRRFGCHVYAPAPEHVVLEHPELASMWVYGAYPPPTLQIKFLQPRNPCPVSGILKPGRFAVAGRTLELVPVPGHSPGQLAVAVEDVLFAADGLFVPEVMDKHLLLFMVNPAQYLQGLETLAGRNERFVVPGHGSHLDRQQGVDPWPAVLAANQEHVRSVQARIRRALASGPLSEEDVLSFLAEGGGKEYDSDPSYYLDRTAVMAHLGHLAAQGEVAAAYDGARRRWRLVET